MLSPFFEIIEVGNYMVHVMWAVVDILSCKSLYCPISVGGEVVWKLLMWATLIFLVGVEML